MRLKLFNLSFFLNMKCSLHKESFVGSWVLYEKDKKDVIHLQTSGSIYRTINVNPTCYSEYLGGWEQVSEKDDFNFNIKDKNYYGKVLNDTLEISGTVCEGKKSPCYISNFTMLPLFGQFHNITFVNHNDNYIYLTQSNVTGRWVMENTHTNQINIIELFNNNTWTSVHSNRDVLRGKWNLYNESNKINTNIASNLFGRNIWLSIVPKNFHCYSENDIMFLGKITQLGKLGESCQIPVSSKINGLVVYCFEMDPEISENFYMKRWFKAS